MATFSEYGWNQMLQAFDSDVSAVTYPTQYYVQACSTASTRATAGTDISTYARVPIQFTRVSDIQRWNPNAAYGGTAASDIDILSFALYDAAVGGNYWAFGNLTTTYTLTSGKILTFEAEKVTIGGGTCL